MSFGVLYKAATGMISLSTGMQTISNNLANLQTVGFKAMRTNYEDLISQSFYTNANPRQVGKGVKVSTIQTIFNQGAFRTTGSDTDIAIAGEGFFNVRTRTGDIKYTRAGVYTWSKDGYLEDPSNNILQGWKMSTPKPGEKAVRLGNPVDIQVNEFTVPPQATAELRLVTNLNASDKAAYYYPEYQLADQLASAAASAAASTAASAASLDVWDPAVDQTVTAVPTSSAAALAAGVLADLNLSSKPGYDSAFIDNYNAAYNTNYTAADIPQLIKIVTNGTEDPNTGRLSQNQFDNLIAETNADMNALAAAAADRAYATTYDTVYAQTYAANAGVGGEGMGFAGAWDATEEPPIANSAYNYTETMTVYDAEGKAHDLTFYYQQNPHMENVWDYIVTCPPEEDARLDGAGNLMSASDSKYAGLLQKGKLTFDANGHIKDLEAENFNVAAGRAAGSSAPAAAGQASDAMLTARIGGHFEADPVADPATGTLTAAQRNYTITWGWQDSATGTWQPSNNATPPSSGFTWTDDRGNSGFVMVDEKSYPGPYEIASGLTVTFESGNRPLNFGAPGQDAISFTAYGDQPAWSQAATNIDGYFTVETAFASSAGTPMAQSIALDMGAKSVAGNWVNDEVSTTQYGSRSSTVNHEQDGHPLASLRRMYVREDGMLMGVYDKMPERELYQVCLTRFRNPNGLSKEGDNLFEATNASGAGITSAPGENGAGKTLGGYLEQSTVDSATEIVQMILTQRGFQANSKSVTTKDAMLATAIELKR